MLPTPDHRPDPRWVRVLDLAVEVGLVGFAVFTVVHLVGAEAGWGVRTTGVLWFLLAAPTMAGMAWWGSRPAHAYAFVGEPDPRRVTRTRAVGCVVLALAAAVGCAVLTGAAFTVPWLVALAVVLACIVWSRGSATDLELAVTPEPAPEPRGQDGWAHVAALVLAVAVGVFVLFVLNPSRDDVYYLNRAAWVAERGTFPDRDTMFGPLTFPSTYGAGLPIAALEEAYGSLARLFGVRAAGLAYLVANPVLAGLSVWAAWRLVRTWASRRALAALAVAVAVPLFTGTGLLGEFAHAREWQGKVVVILLVMPLAWTHLTRLARGVEGTAWSIAVLGVLGVAWSGLTITAPVFAGLLAGVGILAALLLPGVRRPLGLGALALLAAPLLTGVATVLSSSGPVAEENFVSDPPLVWAKVLGEDRPLVVLLGIGLILGPVLARGREARVLAGLGSLVALGVLLPGVFDLLDRLTGTGPIAVRMLFTAPFPVLVGLLVTAPLPAALTARLRAGPRAAAYLPGLVAAAVVVGFLAVAGTPVWTHGAHATLAGSPTWKVKAVHRERVDAVLAEDPGPGPVLLPPGESRTLAITTTEVVSVVPRDYYVQFVQEPQADHDARYAFRRFMDPHMKDPRPAMLADALERLDVSLACVPGRARVQQRTLRTIGLTGERELAGMVCFDGPGAG